MALMQSQQTLKTGDPAPDFRLAGIDGRTYTLADFASAPFLLVVFMCNHCPYVKQKIQTLIKLQAHYEDRGLRIAGINSNDAKNYFEDSFENMIAFARAQGMNFPYLHDPDQTAARAYGAVCTPDPFLFDRSRRLVYQGRIDNALQLGEAATENDVAEVLDHLLAGKQPPAAFKHSMGCSIKWKP